MADTLLYLGSPVTNKTLVLNLLCGLCPRYMHLHAILMRITPFSSFAGVYDDLLLEELTTTLFLLKFSIWRTNRLDKTVVLKFCSH